jgi:hypothetical protein
MYEIPLKPSYLSAKLHGICDGQSSIWAISVVVVMLCNVLMDYVCFIAPPI